MINVIVPTYNEAGNIIPLLNMLKETLERINQEHLIIVVDDNSPDGTAKIVKKLNINNVMLLNRTKKDGLGSAYMYALEYCTFPYTVIIDSDLQHDPSYIIPMFKIVADKKCDIVSGTRYSKGGMICGWSLKRKMVSNIANNIAKYTIGIKASDLTGSFRMYKTDVLKSILKLVQCKGFGIQMEIIARAESMGYKIEETPIIFYDRNSGVSKLGVSEIYMYLKALCGLYLS